VLGTTAERLLEHALAHHAFYEQRKDRENFCELLNELSTK
jgi:hypothetical protein